jgi:hypothetical protein
MIVTSMEVSAEVLKRKGHRVVTGEKLMPFSFTVDRWATFSFP